MESWEALDVDDSDLPSLLRPCKRHHHNQSPIKTTTTTSSSQSNPKTLLSHSQNSNAHSSPPSTPSPPLIPGPAGAVQSAMHRRTHNSCIEDPIPTQEYLRRALEDSDEDADFTRNPWLYAVDFVRQQGLSDGMVIGTPLSAIRSCHNTDRVPQVVAMIKSCTWNGVGDLMVNLKDPTGTIGASIHHRVLAEGEFGRDIAVGAVLVLQKVVVFSPSRSARYLNITLSNVIKVISKNKGSGPPSKQNHSAPAVKDVAPATECGGRPGMPQQAFYLVNGTTEGLLNEVRGTANVRGSAQNEGNSNTVPGSGCYSNGSSRNQNAAVEKEPVTAEGIAVRKDMNDSNLEGVVAGNQPNPWKQAEEGGTTLLGGIQCSSDAINLGEVPTDEDGEIGIKNKLRLPLISRASLPQWTDEQLDELFAADCDNDGSLF